ncbi:hypothetical protein ACLMJK_000890 [Lecanora helva]
MPSEDLKNHATSDTDFYALLGVEFQTSQKDIDRAWRRTALKYHPDKQTGDDPTAKEKFHLAQIGYDLLSDPVSKAIYDNARNAREQRKRQNELFEGRRRQMKDDLEARERGVKRPREEDEVEKADRELKRLAEDGVRRRKAREEALKREIEQKAKEEENNAKTPGSEDYNGDGLKSGVSELDRTVKIRWPVEGKGGSLTADIVKSLFSKFGKVESAYLLNPKMLKIGKRKQLAVVCMLQYKSIIGAHAAVEDFPKQEEPEWKVFDSVFWAANKEPESINASQWTREGPEESAPSTPVNRPVKDWLASSVGSNKSTSNEKLQIDGHGLKNKPSFSSFSKVAGSTPKSSPFGKGLGANSPSLEELTMIRLKNAEKKRLAEEIAKRDAEEDAAAEVEETST